MGKRELIALLNLASWCLVMVERLFLAVPWGCRQFVIVVFPDHTHLLILEISTCYPSNRKDHPDRLLCSFKENFIGLKKVKKPKYAEGANHVIRQVILFRSMDKLVAMLKWFQLKIFEYTILLQGL